MSNKVQQSSFEGTDALATLISQWREKAKKAQADWYQFYSFNSPRAVAIGECADELAAVVASLPSPVVPQLQEEMSRASERSSMGRTGSPRTPPEGSER